MGIENPYAGMDRILRLSRLRDSVLEDDYGGGDTPCSPSTARPYVGIMSTIGAGYTSVEVGEHERTVRVEERWTAEAVAYRLASYPPVDPLFSVPSGAEEARGGRGNGLEFMFSRGEREREGVGSGMRVEILPPSLFLEEAK